DLYDYAADAFTGAGSMSASRTEHAAASLPDGRVLLLGGAGTPSLASADLYDPSTGLFGAAGVLNTGRARMSATPLADGRVLVVGGTDGSAELGTAELFDPGTASFPPADVIPLVNARFGHAAVPLPSGEVVVAGGQDASGYLSYVERYDPAGQDFTPVNSLTTERDTFTFTLLPSGRLLAWGGDNSGQQAPAERYDFFSPAAPATPDLPISASPPSWVPGASLTLSPAAGSFTGSTEAASGDTRSSAVNEPIFVLERQDADGLTYAETTGFPAAGAPATSAQVKLPGALSGGWWWIRALVAGVPGQAEPFFVLAPFYITPTDPTVPPRGSQGFTARGGAGPPYTWSLTTNASGGHIDTDPNTFAGSYLAGATPDVVDVVSVTDAVGNTATTTVHVGDGVTIHGSGPVPPLGAVTFTASGGSGTGYQWTLTTNASGGHVDTDPNTFAGAYVAGNAAGTDRVTVTDSLGNTAYVDVVVTTPVAIAPLTASTTPLGTVDFTASGGAGGYTWTVSHNLSGAGFSSGNPGPNATYQAGRTGSVTDTVRVTDSLGSYAEATVEVSAAISIVPSSATTPPRGSLSFTASGGTDTGFAWSLSTNASGGTIDPSSGAYTAGATPDVTDVVRVEDSLGNLATVEVTVGPGISITPLEPGAYPGQTVTLVAQGGSGTGYTWSMVSVTSNGGTIDPTTGVYTAGTARGATDIVEVTDSLQNVATVDVAVWPDWKPAGSGCGTLGGGTGPLGLLLVFWLGWRGRARRLFGRGARWLGFAALFLVPGVTRAQTPPVSTSFVVQRFQPAGGAYDLLGVESAQVPGHEKLTLRLYGNYASRPLVLSAPGMDKVALLRSQSGVDLTVAVGLMDWAEVSAVVPGVVSQSREQDRFLPPELRQRVASSGLSDLRIVPKARLLELGRFRLGVSAPVSLPTGDRKAFLGQGGFTFGPTALIELDALGPARVLLNGGAIFREERHLIDLTVGNAYTYGAGLEWPFQAGAERFSALGTLQGEAGMKDRSATARPMEALAGLRWMAPSGLLVTLGGGPGIGKGYGTPQYRVFAEIGFTTSTRDRLDRREPEPVKKAEEPKPPEPEVARPEPPAEPPKAEEPKAAEAQPATEPEPQVEPKTLPPPAPTEQVEALRIDARIYFDFNKKEIRDEFRPVLKHLAKRIASEPRMRVVRIEGHADDLGPPDYNLWLSEERARAVKAFLEKNGVPPARIAVIGFGKSKPARPGRSTEDRAKNRRVEFSVEEQ
ncbi:MAG TPA: OmpA family protein, partial [Anaeromyxobacter sp.]|nr:OmpA family protein [Anaeromyxobacter sp.]